MADTNLGLVFLLVDSSDEEKEMELDTLESKALTLATMGEGLRCRGSVPGRYVTPWDQAYGDAKIRADYFCDNPVYTDAKFRRRFHMRRHVVEHIVQEVQGVDSYFVQRPNAAGQMGLTALQKVVASLRILANGVPADAVDECLAWVPGMLGSIDCMHWEWRNYPTAWKGMFTGHGKSPTMILEAVASYDLWIWHAYFGMSGSNNDINVLYRSPLFSSYARGETPPITFTVNGNTYDMGCYLADGIYPDWVAFVKTVRHPIEAKRQHFAALQEGARKDIEHAFGVLQAQWAIVRGPTYGWKRHQISDMMTACIIMHNMIIEDDKTDTTNVSFDNVGHLADTTKGSTSERDSFMRAHHKLRNRDKHIQLQWI